MIEVGSGWIGWTYDQTMDTPMPAIEAAYKGRIDMFVTIGLVTRTAPEAPKPAGRDMSPALFDALFK